MTGFLIGLLTIILVLDCIVLGFLVLIQLPKKEAGLGLAFGGGAADALFGSGSGTILTKATKYAAGIFFVLAILLSVMQSNYSKAGKSDTLQAIEKGTASGGAVSPLPATMPEKTIPPGAAPPAPTAPPPATTTSSTSAPILVVPTPPAATPGTTNPTPPK